MPTRFGRFRRRYLDTQGRNSRARLGSIVRNRAVQLSAPWGGFTPDLPRQAITLADAQSTNTMISHQGDLRLNFGFGQVDSANLPLDTGNPVVGLMSYRELASPQNVRQFAVTAAATGRLFELVAGTWTERALEAGHTVLTGTASDLVDWTFFPPGDFIVFCNGVEADPAMQFAVGANTYGEFNFGDNWPGGGDPDLFRARSVESADDRLVFLGTNEGGTSFFNRVRWTTVGSNATLTPTSLGAGFINLDELSVGLKVLRSGHTIAAYFDNGVAVLTRTGLAAEAFRRVYISHERGLLGTHAVTQLGGGWHFGIFTDGWYIVNPAQNEWREVGLRDINGKLFPKWRDTFYSILNRDAVGRIALAFDRDTHHIKIAFPTGQSTANDTVWDYDIDEDSVWPDGGYGTDVPNIWGKPGFDEDTSVAWSAFAVGDPAILDAGDWGDTPETWASFANQAVRFLPTHGTTAGYVFRHIQPGGALTRELSTGTVTPTYSYQSHLSPLGHQSQLKVIDKLHVSYIKDSSQEPIGVTTRSANQSFTANMNTTKGNDGEVQVEPISPGRVAGNYIGYTLAGTGPVRLPGVEVEYEFEGGQETSEGFSSWLRKLALVGKRVTGTSTARSVLSRPALLTPLRSSLHPALTGTRPPPRQYRA
jgi:hypothetical protein